MGERKVDIAYCGSCGEKLSAAARFCEHCGAEQQVGARGKAEQLAPGSTELLDQLAARLRAPGVALAGLSALVGAGVCLAFGLVVAAVFPQASPLSIGDGGLLKETLMQAASFSQANLELVEPGEPIRMAPVLFVLIPVLGVAAGTLQLAPRTAGLPTKERLLWAAGAGLPFALIMLVASVSAGSAPLASFGGEVKPMAGSVFVLSLIWGALGGLLGMVVALRRESVAASALLPSAVERYAGIAWTALRPLALALAAVAVLGALTWAIQVARYDDYRGYPPRSTPAVAAEQLAYAGDRAVGMLSLGSGASLRLAGTPVVPIDPARAGDLVDEFSEGTAPTYTIFAFGGAMPAYLFVPMLLVLIAIPALLALYAGFMVARRLGDTRVERAAAWGAIVGPVWAFAMVALAALARKSFIVDPVGDSVFVAFLLGGAVLGALGGVLAVQAAARPPAVQPPPPGGNQPVR